MGLALEEPGADDVKVTDGGLRLYLDRRVASWFDGAELGFESDNWGGGFTFNHPNLGSC